MELAQETNLLLLRAHFDVKDGDLPEMKRIPRPGVDLDPPKQEMTIQDVRAALLGSPLG